MAYKPKYAVFKKLCKRDKVTAYKVAKDTGVSRATFTRWKSDSGAPKIQTIAKIAEFFGVPVEEFYK